MDARAQRSRTKLFAAVLELAESEGIEAVSMVAIAQTAGVNRSTVYEHASSPLDLLRMVLREELDEIRARHLSITEGADVAEAVRLTTRDVLHHIDDHAAIYSRALGSDESTTLHGMLSTHFRQSTLQLLASGALVRPDDPTLDAHLQDVAVARFIADGTVGAIDTWLRTEPPRDVEAFLALYRMVLPSWWPIA
jgi:AcrR family transcriptional regulator